MSNATMNASVLSHEQCECYHADGFLVLRQFFAMELLEAASAEANGLLQRYDLISRDNLRCRWQGDAGTGEPRFETFDPVVDIAPVCRELATDPRLMAALADLYGEPGCLFKDKLIFKPPGVRGYGLHQDWIAWKSFPRSFLTVLIPIDASNIQNGCTEVFPGYHRQGSLSPEDGHYHELPANVVDEASCVPLELHPGDIAVFGGFTPHRSGPNRSPQWRRQLYFSYNMLSDGGDQRDKHYQEFHRWLRATYGNNDAYFH